MESDDINEANEVDIDDFIKAELNYVRVNGVWVTIALSLIVED